MVSIGMSGGCRRYELCQLTTDDIEDLNSAMLIKLHNPKNKTSRSFVLTDICYDTCKKYSNLRPTSCSTNRFFLNYNNGKCTRQVVGINKIGQMATEVAKFLKLENPETYTAQSFYRSSLKLSKWK